MYVSKQLRAFLDKARTIVHPETVTVDVPTKL
jgi:hypothetical protein